MSSINIIKIVKANFENISGISRTTLILGQLFILFLLLGSLAYIIFNLYIAQNTGLIAELMLIGTLARDNSIITLAIIWGGSLFIDCVEKHENR